MSSEAAQKAYPHDGHGKTDVQLARHLALREGFDAGARHALEEAANGNVPGELSKDARRQVEAWLRARALAVGDNRNQED